MSWGKKQIAGVSYELGHLDPVIMDVTPKVQDAPTYKVHVSFGCHTFTKGWENGYSPDLLTMARNVAFARFGMGIR